MAIRGQDIRQAKALLREGELVAIPTETVYGLAGNAFNPHAVASIYEVKNRPTFNPLITHTDRLEKAAGYVQSVPPLAKKLAETFWPGPLTLLLPKATSLPDLVTAGSDLVAVRIPQHPLTLSLLQQLDFPLAAPSANPFGYISPTTAEHVSEQLGSKIAYILDGGACSVGIESTIVGVEDDTIVVYRLGGISTEDLQQVSQRVRMHEGQRHEMPTAPGMLKSHYAPARKVIIGNLSELILRYDPERTALISFRNLHPQIPEAHQRVLSASGDLNEAAQQLFSALRQLDKLPVEVILAEFVPNYGLGRAINDRLTRASA
ncbi:MAG: L-threonylcarbamoyladenylate synthase [Imperialibacter sp.]|uniref:L-threonylcarbamoyladenylate synthase n=1 Tax=Imperialibacter sp. TaxID=2038411 RepID=UPI0032EE1100